MTSPTLSRVAVTVASLVLLSGLLAVALLEHRRRLPGAEPKPVVSSEAARCYRCHDERTPGLVAAWRRGRHAQVAVDCMGCHRAAPADRGAELHEGQWMVAIPSPARCGSCHPKQLAEFQRSRHADAAACIDEAAQALAARPGANLLGRCRRCHGGREEVDTSGRPSPATWPGGGMGRLHPDGSRGNCGACHTRHEFSLALARSPEACGKCHGGAEHPQLAHYEASRHGLRLRALRSQAALDAHPWVAGATNRVAPTCSTCHMGATPTRPVTHDASARLAFQLRDLQHARRPEFGEARAAMSDVCRSCHSDRFFGTALARMGSVVAEENKRLAALAGQGGPKTAHAAMERALAAPASSSDGQYRELLQAAHMGRAGLHAAACGMAAGR